MMPNVEFANPEFFWLLIVPAVTILWYIFREKKQNAPLPLPGSSLFLPKKETFHIVRHIPFFLRIIAILLMITALARPQSSTSWQNITSEGIEIVLCMDISGSMLAEDLKPNRLEAAKNVAIDFIQKRPNDRIGLVVFAGKSFTQCPVTTDHDVLKNLFEGIKHGIIEDGTAIGMGLANAVNRMKDSEAKSKVVILLTDGENTAGNIPPLTAAEIAKNYKVRVYTIGVGTNGLAPMPVQGIFGGKSYQNVEVRIDEVSMKKIAELTGGKYFRATDNQSLEAIYEEIDKMEKSRIEVTEYRKKTELFLPVVFLTSLLLLIEFILKYWLIKTFN